MMYAHNKGVLIFFVIYASEIQWIGEARFVSRADRVFYSDSNIFSEHYFTTE